MSMLSTVYSSFKNFLMGYNDIQSLQDRHNDWLSALDCYADDLDNLRNRLSRLIIYGTQAGVYADIEQFENKFEEQRQHIRELTHRVKSSMHAFAIELKDNTGKIADELVSDMKGIKTGLAAIEKNIFQLRQSFHAFLSTVEEPE